MSHPIVEQILAGRVAPMVKLAAAKGALPIPREDQIELWGCLRNDPDAEIKVLARENLAAIPVEEWLEVLQAHPFRPEFFAFAVKILAKDGRIAMTILRNKALPDAAIEELAKNSSPQITDLVLDGQARLIGCPGIVISLLNNPQLNATQGRRIYDLAEQFFRGHSEIPALVEKRVGLKVEIAEAPAARKDEAPKPPPKPVEKPPELAPEAAPEPQAEAAPREEAEAQPAPEGEAVELPHEALKDGELGQEEVKNLYQKILTMSVPHKVELALKGNKEARGLLIRDSNKVVQEAVVTSPKITEQEIETIARLRNLPEEILRKISTLGEFMKKYNIMKALATNPRTPLAISMTLIAKFNELDLKFLLKDKNVSEALRREGKKIWEMRHAQKKTTFKKH